MTDSKIEKPRSLSVICSKGSFDMAYPGLILANAARMAGVDARLFFTFWGLDIVNEKKIDHLHLNLVGNPSAPVPAMIAGLPGVEALATAQMRSWRRWAPSRPQHSTGYDTFITSSDSAGSVLGDARSTRGRIATFELRHSLFLATGQGATPKARGRP